MTGTNDLTPSQSTQLKVAQTLLTSILVRPLLPLIQTSALQAKTILDQLLAAPSTANDTQDLNEDELLDITTLKVLVSCMAQDSPQSTVKLCAQQVANILNVKFPDAVLPTLPGVPLGHEVNLSGMSAVDSAEVPSEAPVA